MKATQISESIEWASPDHEWYMSLQGLINQNNGLFKSPKQASFILNRWAGKVVDGPEAERYANNFGTPVATGNRVIQTTGYYRWADYGSRSVIPFLYIFEVDDFGVVRKWKVGYRGNMRDGAAPDPKKAKLEFTRDAGLDTSHLIVQKSDAEKKAEFVKGLGGSVGKYIGEEGTRHNFGPVTLKKAIDLGYRPAGPYGEARAWMNVYHDADGNIIYHTTGSEPSMKEGETMNMVARIKKHMVSKRQEKVTIVNRPKFTAAQKINEEDVANKSEVQQIASKLTFVPVTKKAKKYKFVADGRPGTLPPMSYTVAKQKMPVVTITSDGKETQNIAAVNDIIMSGPSRENYVVKAEKFSSLYNGNIGSTVIPDQSVRYVAKYTGNRAITFMSSFGQEMVLKPGDYLVNRGDRGFYRIAKNEYEQTYNPKVEKVSIEEDTDLGPYDFFTEKQTEFLEGYLSNLIKDAVEITEITATGRTGRGMPIYRVFISYDGKDDRGYRGTVMITGRPEGERTVVDIDIYDLRGYGRQHPSVDFQNYDD